jgi:peptidyl-prolyl cis-trans isomerase SurA
MGKRLPVWREIYKAAYIAAIIMPLMIFGQQNNTIDGIEAVVGNHIILKSDIESQYMQYTSQGMKEEESLRCKILEELLFQKLLVLQAAIDSVKITDSQVEDEIDKRIRYFIRQLGSKEKLEEYYKKSLFQIKAEFRDVIKDLLLAQTVEQKITKDLKVTPSEVKSYFRSLPDDSLPKISSEVEIGVIVKKATVNNEEKKLIRTKLTGIRERIMNGEKFSTLAVLYSEDEATSGRGGELGTRARGELIPEFEAVAFNLKAGEVSPLIETPDGFYIIQVIDRKGDYINIRQLMLKPKVSEEDLYSCKLKLDSILPSITSGKTTFANAAAKYSDDKQTRNNEGLMINPQTGNSKWQIEELDQTMFFIIDKMKVGDVSNSALFTDEDGRKAYRIIYLKSRTDPHRANLKDDYDKIQNAALSHKRAKIIDEWITTKLQNTYIRITDDYKDCRFKHHWKRGE